MKQLLVITYGKKLVVLNLKDVVFELATGLKLTKSQVRRLIKQGAVKAEFIENYA